MWNVSVLTEDLDDTVEADRKLLAARWAWERKEWYFDRFDEVFCFGCLDGAELESLATRR
ncbi:hypothetical protein FP2506_01040 [Fulvimarina pelagi HTCC2506]|uniref:Uncharacterized protein n=1 Tax=Fulvimarina pelagi HTCC2506 TaxID=314231 RepID=Q0G289_9HYPH|nr:hypothetical protein FP2506_01040 [Fulvimarina pelagi HTCC2506]